MTQNSTNFIILLATVLFLLVNCYVPPRTQESDPTSLQCNESKTENTESIFCEINSTIVVHFLKTYYYTEDKQKSSLFIHYYCYNATLLDISLPLEENNTTTRSQILSVIFHSCRFSANDHILKILTQSLKLYKVQKINLHFILIDNSLSRSHLKGLGDVVESLKFNITNVSALPPDLLADFKYLYILEICLNSINTSHLSALLTPLENLKILHLKKKKNKEISGSIFGHENNLELYSSSANNISLLTSSGPFSNLRSLKFFYLTGNSIPSENSNDISLELPDGLLRDLPSLEDVNIESCQLESIPPDIFVDSKNISYINFQGNNLKELPLGLFSDQEILHQLILSKNMIRTLVDGLLSTNKRLMILDLSDNQLTSLSNDIFRPLTELRSIDLENNKLLTMSPDFYQTQHAFYLKLRNNLIKEIPYSIITSHKNLYELDLSFNKISSINCNFLTYFDSIINITENPINCDYKVLCLHNHLMIQNPIKNTFGLKTIKCESPFNLKGQFLYDLKLKELLCFPDMREGNANASKRCTYNIRTTTTDSVLVMNCSDKNFNDIPTIPLLDQSFPNSIELIMDNNHLESLSSKILKNNANISMISIVNSPENSLIKVLPEGFLSNLPKLKTISLVLPLENISSEIFIGSFSIETFKLSGTSIEELPDLFFVDQRKLMHLDLSSNKLKIFRRGHLFGRILNWEKLQLSHNHLYELHSSIFYGLRYLKELYLDNNNLQFVALDVFSNTPSLEFVNMENNQLTTIEPFFKLLKTLQTLILRNNSIGNDYFMGIKRLNSSFLDLSFHNICSIKLSHPDSISFSDTFSNFTNTNIRTIKDQNGNTPLKCNCKIISYSKNKTNVIMYESLQCLSPDSLKEREISNISLEELVCPAKNTSICPERCFCWIRPVDSTLIVNCTDASLNKVPPLPELKTTFQNGIELFIEHNQLTSLRPYLHSGHDDVIKIFAAHNQIINMTSEDIPQKISYLDISHNQIERLDEKVIKLISESRALKTIRLFGNPIICDCQSENLIRLVSRNISLFTDYVECEDGRNLATLSYADICLVEPSNADILISTLLIVILSAVLVLTILYFLNREHILVWMYAHQICLYWITEDELDKDKKYDAFVSYSSFDADFVAVLVSKLETGPNSYKLCLHDRDWLAGDYIPHQIETSVSSSRRTIICMTENYMKSQWTCLEFRTAHNATMNEKVPRVIVIIVGDVNIENLDSDLRKYIEMYTYLKWEEPWFWERLRYALPHSTK